MFGRKKYISMPESRKRGGKKAHNKRIKLRNERIKQEFIKANKEVRKKLEAWKEEQKLNEVPHETSGPRDIRFTI